MSAFRHVLGRRQSKYQTVIAWLELRIKHFEGEDPKTIHRMRRLTRGDVLSVI
jgi:hypothetical protein